VVTFADEVAAKRRGRQSRFCCPTSIEPFSVPGARSFAMTTRPIDPLPKVWDPDAAIGEMLKGKKGLVVGIANDQSIAFGCAAKLRAFGAELAVTWLNEKAEPHVRPLAEQLQASFAMPLDVEKEGELEAVFARVDQEWGRL